MLVTVHGQVVFEYANVAQASKIASVRKSGLMRMSMRRFTRLTNALKLA